MPELPEVETTVRELKKTLINLGVVDVWSDWEKSIKSQSLKIFKQNIVGEKILNISRRAKIIIFELSGEKILLAHQKMTGHFLIGNWKYNPRAKRKWQSVEVGPLHDRVNDYIHIMFWLNNGRQLAFSDLRKFGWVSLYKNTKLEDIAEIKLLGPEPLSKKFTVDVLKRQLAKTRRPIKQALMDQKIIAGIGNIYADESLFLSKIHPLIPANKLSFRKIKELHKAIQSTLKIAIKNKGTTILSGAEEYRLPRGERGKYQEMRKVYRREGEPCPVCGTKIKRIKIGQRSAHFCSACQKLD